MSSKSNSSSSSSSKNAPVGLEDLNKDLISLIASKLPNKDIRSMISTSKSLAKDINDGRVFRKKLKDEFGIKDWKTAYEMIEYLVKVYPRNLDHINDKNFLTLTTPYRCPSSLDIRNITRQLLAQQVKAPTIVERFSIAVRIFKLINICFVAFRFNREFFRVTHDKIIEMDNMLKDPNIVKAIANKSLIDEYKMISNELYHKIESVLNH